MKLTETKLRKIIREEVQKLNEIRTEKKKELADQLQRMGFEARLNKYETAVVGEGGLEVKQDGSTFHVKDGTDRAFQKAKQAGKNMGMQVVDYRNVDMRDARKDQRARMDPRR